MIRKAICSITILAYCLFARRQFAPVWALVKVPAHICPHFSLSHRGEEEFELDDDTRYINEITYLS